jgi:hypothetical protein
MEDARILEVCIGFDTDWSCPWGLARIITVEEARDELKEFLEEHDLSWNYADAHPGFPEVGPAVRRAGETQGSTRAGDRRRDPPRAKTVASSYPTTEETDREASRLRGSYPLDNAVAKHWTRHE